MFYVAGRKVKVATGAYTQTVNICTDANLLGEYDYILRLHESLATEEELVQQRFARWHTASRKSSPVMIRRARFGAAPEAHPRGGRDEKLN